ncbi:hypothetical protein LCGC14_0448850 [marine sediment metagenome]|uniref:Uncharacterized protein n=1 Tax=marine sediment metagenome TaxID=412755 RepID=A0A0F9SNZ3_9ZZZZ
MGSAAHAIIHGEDLRITIVSCGHNLGCGCAGISDCCFTCPLIICRFDKKGGVREIRNTSRNQEIVRMRRLGKTVNEISSHFELSKTAISRILRKNNGRLD